jgi:hypothetical protein
MAGSLTLTTLSDGTNSTSVTNAIKGSAKAWVNFQGGQSGTTAGTINSSYNISSITVNGTGDYTANFTNAMADANYAWSGSGINSGGTGPALVTWTSSSGTQSTTQLRVKLVDSTAGNTFSSYRVYLIICGN